MRVGAGNDSPRRRTPELLLARAPRCGSSSARTSVGSDSRGSRGCPRGRRTSGRRRGPTARGSRGCPRGRRTSGRRRGPTARGRAGVLEGVVRAVAGGDRQPAVRAGVLEGVVRAVAGGDRHDLAPDRGGLRADHHPQDGTGCEDDCQDRHREGGPRGAEGRLLRRVHGGLPSSITRASVRWMHAMGSDPTASSGTSLIRRRESGCELGPVADIHLGQHVRYVAFDGLARQEQRVGDLGIRRPLGDERRHFHLAARQGPAAVTDVGLAAPPSPDAELTQTALGEARDRRCPHLRRACGDLAERSSPPRRGRRRPAFALDRGG